MFENARTRKAVFLSIFRTDRHRQLARWVFSGRWFLNVRAAYCGRAIMLRRVYALCFCEKGHPDTER